MAEITGEDLLLAVLVQGFNSSTDPETSASITLTVSGLVVTGDLVPAWVWFQEVRRLLSGGSGTGVGGMADVFGMFADDALGEVLIRDATGDVEEVNGAGTAPAAARALPTTIHLARAQILGAHHHQELAGGLWRGRLSHISGWTFGRFEP